MKMRRINWAIVTAAPTFLYFGIMLVFLCSTALALLAPSFQKIGVPKLAIFFSWLAELCSGIVKNPWVVAVAGAALFGALMIRWRRSKR